MMSPLRVDKQVYEARRDRLKRLIELNAPPVIILMSVRSVEKCFHRRSFSQWLHDWQYGSYRLKGWPHWLLWLVDRDYREVCREEEELDESEVGQ
jgi:hypothetical protein